MMMNFSSVAAPATTNNTVTLLNVQGNIAAGKTTLLEDVAGDPTRLARLLFGDDTTYTHACVVLEPLGQWTSVGAQETDLLKAMYDNPKAHGFACQLNIINTQLAAITDAMRAALRKGAAAPGEPVRMLVVTERSTEASKHIFAQSLHDGGLIGAAEWKVYCDSFDAAHALWRESVRQLFPHGVTVRSGGTVHLLVTPEEALARTKRRGRAAEADVKLELFQRIDAAHRRLYSKRNAIVRDTVVSVDSSMLRAVLKGQLSEKQLLTTTIRPVPVAPTATAAVR